MHSPVKTPIFSPLSAKFMRVVLSIYLLVAILVTAMHILVDFRETRKNVIQYLSITQKSYESGIARAVWFMDSDYLKGELEGIMENPDIIGVKINDDHSNIYAAGEVVQQNDSAAIVHYYNQNWVEQDILANANTQLIEHVFPLIHIAEDNEQYKVGTATIYSGNRIIFNKLKPRMVLIIINSIIKTAALALIFLLVGRRLLGVPLAIMTRSAARINLDNLEESKMDMGLKDRNELKVLEEAFNTMIDNLIGSRQSLNNYMQSEKDKLEVLVAERTSELVASETKYRDSEAELQALFTSMTDVILVFSQEGRYLKIAPTSPGLLYKPGNELINKTLHDVFPKKEADKFLTTIQDCLLRQTTVSMEYDLLINQKKIRFDARVSPISKDMVIFVARDITERRQWELELERSRQEAETANRTKSEFLANMSHELRTPLNAILGFSELMSRDTGLSSEQLTNLAIIGRSGEHLLSLINDVLEFAKIEAGQIVLHQESFDLHHLLLNLQEMFQLRAQQKGLTLDFVYDPDVPQFIRTDHNKLRQILINLLDNAVKYTETGTITLSVTRNKQQDLQKQTDACLLHFEVADTGKGILPEEQVEIFDAFFQSVDQRLPQQGTGLGLSISQKFTRLLGGVLSVNSEFDQGTSFIFDISVQLAENAETESLDLKQRVTGLMAGQAVFRLLVVEDNETNRNLLVKLLQTIGFAVQEAVNGQEAIEIYHKWHPHLIWMDIRMPVMDGYEAITRIKKSAEGKDTVIIALTASAFEEDRLKVIEHGGNDFVRKPFKEADIFTMIQKYLGVHYVYRAGGETAESEVLCKQMSNASLITSINKLSAEIIATLKEATELSDAAMIEQVIADIGARDLQLAGALTELADNYAYDKILVLVKKGKETTAVNQDLEES